MVFLPEGLLYTKVKEKNVAEIVDKIRHYAETLGGNHWTLSPLLERLAADGGALHQYSN